MSPRAIHDVPREVPEPALGRGVRLDVEVALERRVEAPPARERREGREEHALDRLRRLPEANLLATRSDFSSINGFQITSPARAPRLITRS